MRWTPDSPLSFKDMSSKFDDKEDTRCSQNAVGYGEHAVTDGLGPCRIRWELKVNKVWRQLETCINPDFSSCETERGYL